MARHLQGIYWGTEKSKVTTPHKGLRQAMGIHDHTRWARTVAEGQQIEAQELYDTIEDPLIRHSSTARQAFQALRGAHTQAHIAPPLPCSQLPPADINTYSDGCLFSPTEPLCQLGWAGVWWPNRHLDTHSPSDAEANMAVLDPTQEGLKLLTYLPGFGGSSTRQELAGAIVAMAANGPVHLGTDSQAFLDKEAYVHQLAQQGKAPRRPWALHKDGDLWKQFHAHLVAKGHTSVRFTKVKGHATQAMVEEGHVQQAPQTGQ